MRQKRFKNTVFKSERQNIFKRFFTQIMIEPEYLIFCKNRCDNFIQFFGRFQVFPNGLFDNNSCPSARTFIQTALFHIGKNSLIKRLRNSYIKKPISAW